MSSIWGGWKFTVVILVQEEQDPNNGGFTVGAQPAEAVHVQQWDPGAGFPGEAGEPGEAADVADGGQPRVEQPGLQLPPRLLPSLPLNPRPAGCHPGDEGQCQKVKFPANPGNPDNPDITGGVKARTCLANHRPQEIQL